MSLARNLLLITAPLLCGASAMHFAKTLPVPPAPKETVETISTAAATMDPLEAALLALPSEFHRASAAAMHIQNCPLVDLLVGLRSEPAPAWLSQHATVAHQLVAARLIREAPEEIYQLIAKANHLRLKAATQLWIPTSLGELRAILMPPAFPSDSEGAAYIQCLYIGDFSGCYRLLNGISPKPEDKLLAAEMAIAGGFSALANQLGDDEGKLERAFDLVRSSQPDALWEHCKTLKGPARERLLFQALMAACGRKPGKFAELFPQLAAEEQRWFYLNYQQSDFLLSQADADAFALASKSNDPGHQERLDNAMTPQMKLEHVRRELHEGSEEYRVELRNNFNRLASSRYQDLDGSGIALQELKKETPEIQALCLPDIMHGANTPHEAALMHLLQNLKRDELAKPLASVPDWLWERQPDGLRVLVEKLPPSEQSTFRIKQMLAEPNNVKTAKFFSDKLLEINDSLAEAFQTWSLGHEEEALALLNPVTNREHYTYVLNRLSQRDPEFAFHAFRNAAAHLKPVQAMELFEKISINSNDPFNSGKVVGNLDILPPVIALAKSSTTELDMAPIVRNATADQWQRWVQQLTPEQQNSPKVKDLMEQRAREELMQALFKGN